MRNSLILLIALTGCGAVDPAEMEARQYEKMQLSEKEREVAAALTEGYRREVRRDMLRSQDYGRAGCYAKKVEMPARFRRVHIEYLRDYPNIEKNYYPWFAKRGVGEQDAWRVGQIVTETLDKCSLGALLKEKLADG